MILSLNFFFYFDSMKRKKKYIIFLINFNIIESDFLKLEMFELDNSIKIQSFLLKKRHNKLMNCYAEEKKSLEKILIINNFF